MQLAIPGDREVEGRLTAGIAGSNPAEGINVPLLCLLCVVYREVSQTDLSLVQRSPSVCVCVCVCVCV
jgi:hypothetical protein